MTLLREHLALCDREKVVEDTVHLIENEVKSKSGLSGMAVKGGYSVVRRLRNGTMIAYACDRLLDSFTDALSPLYESYVEQGGESFESFLRGKEDEAAEALLSVTDQMMDRKSESGAVLQKTYISLRKQAKGHVVDAVPKVARLIDQHLGKGEKLRRKISGDVGEGG